MQSRDIRILKEIAEALNGAAGVDQALRDALARVADLLGVRTGWVWLIDARTGRFYSAAAQALPPFLQDPVRMTGKTCWCIDAFRSGQLTAGNIDVIECSRLRAALRIEPASGASAARGTGRLKDTRGLRFHASIPLLFGGRRLGIMNLATPEWRRLSRRELDLLSTIASQIAVAIERARLADESVRLARIGERERLARDLHDTLTQRLTAIGLHIEAALADATQPAARAQLQRASSIVQSSLDEARRSLRELRTSALEGRPLAAALADAGRQMTADSGIRVHVRSTGEPELPPHVEDELFRIAAEALANVRRHSGAREVEVSLTRTARRARLRIVDDGKGFDGRLKANGFGIPGMRERSATIGGRLTIRARPGRGTEIDVTVPLAGEVR